MKGGFKQNKNAKILVDDGPFFSICKFCGRRGFGELFKRIHTVSSCLNMMEQKFKRFLMERGLE